jgi:hypothetical protein
VLEVLELSQCKVQVALIRYLELLPQQAVVVVVIGLEPLLTMD